MFYFSHFIAELVICNGSHCNADDLWSPDCTGSLDPYEL